MKVLHSEENLRSALLATTNSVTTFRNYYCSPRRLLQPILLVATILSALSVIAHLYAYHNRQRPVMKVTFPTAFQRRCLGDAIDPVRSKRRVVVLLWPHKLSHDMIGSSFDDALSGCSPTVRRRCSFTYNINALASADAVLVQGAHHGLDHLPSQRQRTPGQLWLFLELESPGTIYNPLAHVPPSYFNATMTYRFDSDYPILYNSLNLSETARAKGFDMHATKRRDRVAIAFTSSFCDSERHKYMTRLRTALLHGKKRLSPSFSSSLLKTIMRNIGLCSGDKAKCERTADLGPITSFPDCERKLVEPYYFYMAFENSLCEDYVTEKLYRALQLGVVPVVNNWRADYSRFAPKGSYIEAWHYKTPSALAKHLLSVAADKEAYNRLHAWRADPVAAFRYLPAYRYKPFAAHECSGLCRLCEDLLVPGRLTRREVVDLELWWGRNGTVCSKYG